MNNIIRFIYDNRPEHTVSVPRTEKFNEIAKELSDFVATLPLEQSDNDRLIKIIVKQINEAERGAYLAGFDMGIKAMKENVN